MKDKTPHPTYASLTDEQKKTIDGLFELYIKAGPAIIADNPGHLAACIASDIFGMNKKRATKRDADSWSAVLTYLVFTDKIRTTIKA